ncbi:MAG: DUF1080 domain-containing protein [Verrucomicrobia bacterium]|nr:DUF1080 domain-containing protein [Verrucomicrobiota bacterium]
MFNLNLIPDVLARFSHPAGRRQSVCSLARLLLAVLVLAGVSSLRSQAAEAEEAPGKSAWETNPEGWTDLMPGTDLKGWARVPIPPTAKLGRAQWHVDTERKVLICDGDGGHDMLLWEQVLGDAIFHFEFRYTRVEGMKGYNSGAYIRNSPNGSIWHQAQFGDADGGFLFGVTPVPNAKPRFFILKNEVKEGRIKPAGEWNTLELTARGPTLTLWVNGAVTCRFDACGADQGQIGVEAEGYRIEFRNLKLKELR